MKSTAIVAAAVAALLGACKSPGTYVRVTIDANPPLQDIDYLECVAEHDGSSSGVIHIPFRAHVNPPILPPKADFALQFHDTTHGPVRIHLEAFNAEKHQLASGDAVGAMVVPHEVTDTTIVLGTPTTDGGVPDMVAPDLVHVRDLLPEWGFQPAHTIGGVRAPWVFEIEDLDRDGHLDLVVADLPDSVSLFYGRGDGTFDAPGVLSAGFGVAFVAVGDWNRDFQRDILVANKVPGLSMLRGRGGRQFNSASTFSMIQSYHVINVDYNRDSNEDVVAIRSNGIISSIRGAGNGAFAAPIDSMLAGASLVTLGDLNRDAKLDAMVAYHGNGSGGFAVMLGDGAGNFSPPVNNIQTTEQIGLPRLWDVNGDDLLDFITTEPGTNGLAIREGKGDGTFEMKRLITSVDPCSPLALTDVNGDQLPDIIGIGMTSSAQMRAQLVVFVGDGKGNFMMSRAFTIEGALPGFAAVADLNKDSRPDVVLSFPTEGLLRILLGR